MGMNWISVKDKVPDEEGYYLCFHPTYRRNICILSFREFTKDSRKRFWDQGGKESKITHWMPLPELPE